MKLTKLLFLVAALCTGICHASTNEFVWSPLSPRGTEVEFSITSSLGGATEELPKVIESGYSGAFWFGELPYSGVAQTFTVPSPRILQSISLRLGRFDNARPTGSIEIGIFRFDAVNGTPMGELAAILVDAGSFSAPIESVPISQFDFSQFALILRPQNSYAIAVMPTETYTGGLMTLQSATNIYPGGEAYALSLIPEPPPLAMAFGAIGAFVSRRRRT